MRVLLMRARPPLHHRYTCNVRQLQNLQEICTFHLSYLAYLQSPRTTTTGELELEYRTGWTIPLFMPYSSEFPFGSSDILSWSHPRFLAYTLGGHQRSCMPHDSCRVCCHPSRNCRPWDQCGAEQLFDVSPVCLNDMRSWIQLGDIVLAEVIDCTGDPGILNLCACRAVTQGCWTLWAIQEIQTGEIVNSHP